MGPALQYICFVGQGPCALPGMWEKTGRADVGIGPYESVTRGEVRNPPVTASLCQPPLGKRTEGTGDGLPQPVCALASQ